MNLNKVFILGRVVDAPQLRTTPAGYAVATFSIATNRIWTRKTDGQRQTDVQYHNIVVWSRQAEIAAQFLTKGCLVLIEGRLQTRVWQDRQGQNRRTTEIVCERLQLGPRPLGAVANPARQEENNPGGGEINAENKEMSEAGAEMVQPPAEEEIRPEDLPF